MLVYSLYHNFLFVVTLLLNSKEIAEQYSVQAEVIVSDLSQAHEAERICNYRTK